MTFFSNQLWAQNWKLFFFATISELTGEVFDTTYNQHARLSWHIFPGRLNIYKSMIQKMRPWKSGACSLSITLQLNNQSSFFSDEEEKVMSMGEVLPKLMAHYPLACTYYLKLRTATIKALQGKSYSTL